MNSVCATVLERSEQGDDARVQQVAVIVETHEVTVQHPAQLQETEPAEQT